MAGVAVYKKGEREVRYAKINWIVAQQGLSNARKAAQWAGSQRAETWKSQQMLLYVAIHAGKQLEERL